MCVRCWFPVDPFSYLSLLLFQTTWRQSSFIIPSLIFPPLYLSQKLKHTCRHTHERQREPLLSKRRSSRQRLLASGIFSRSGNPVRPPNANSHLSSRTHGVTTSCKRDREERRHAANTVTITYTLTHRKAVKPAVCFWKRVWIFMQAEIRREASLRWCENSALTWFWLLVLLVTQQLLHLLWAPERTNRPAESRSAGALACSKVFNRSVSSIQLWICSERSASFCQSPQEAGQRAIFLLSCSVFSLALCAHVIKKYDSQSVFPTGILETRIFQLQFLL